MLYIIAFKFTYFLGIIVFATKVEVRDLRAKTFVFTAQKTMYGGKHIAKGDTVFIFASENDGGRGLIARGAVTSSQAIPKKGGVARQTHRVSTPSNAPLLRIGHWGGANSNNLPTGMMASRKPSSISNSMARQRTKSSASRMKRWRFSTDSSSVTSLFVSPALSD
jgi:hypothetical protein